MAAAAAGGCSGAGAMTVQLYGVVDASIEYAKGSQSVVRMREGQQAASRWGLRGNVTNNSIVINPGSGDDARSISVGLRHRF